VIVTMRRRSVLAAPLLIALRPASATPEAMEAAIQRFTGGAPVKTGRVALDIAPLVENGNAVPVKLSVDSPMTAASHVSAIALFTPRNPQPDVAIFRLGPRAGRAVVSTRMRLATSQTVVAMAQLSDGSFWQTTVDVEVTLAACVEGS
jgi:sulfur-oxidizing protein SoxY